MSKSVGTVRGVPKGTIGNDKGGNASAGDIGKAQGLRTIQNTQLRREVQQGISKYETRLGVRQVKVQLAPQGSSLGVHVTEGGKSEGVYLNTAVFKKGTVSSVSTITKGAYKSGFLTNTNKPVQHVVVHELSHAQWNSHLKSANAKAAAASVQKKYKQFLKDYASGKAKGFGKYSTTNVNEFWAEASTKHVLGKPDKYTRFIKSTIKKYKL